MSASARLLRLLALLQVRRVWPGPELADRLAVTDRTLRRDIERLRSLGYPVEGASGVAGGYRLGHGAELPPLSLADDEALAVSLALASAAAGLGAGVEEAALRALVKLERVLPERLRRRANALRGAIVTLNTPDSAANPTKLALIAGACDEQRRLAFTYVARERTTNRDVEPAGLVHAGRRWYLVAFDPERDDWRTFRVDRIEDAELGPRFSPRPRDFDLKDFVGRSVSIGGYPFRAVLILEAPYEAMTKRISPTNGTLEPVDDARCRLIVGASSLEGLAWWVAHFGVEFTVVEPAELVEHLTRVRDRIDRAVNAHPGTTSRSRDATGTTSDT